MELKMSNLKIGMPLYVKVKNAETERWEVKQFSVYSLGYGEPVMIGESGTERIYDIDFNTRIYEDETDCQLECAGLNGDIELFESIMLQRGVDLSDDDVFNKFVANTLLGATCIYDY